MRGHHPAHAHCRSRFRVKGVYEISSDLSRREMCRRINQWSENTVAHTSQQIRLQEHSPRVFFGCYWWRCPIHFSSECTVYRSGAFVCARNNNLLHSYIALPSIFNAVILVLTAMFCVGVWPILGEEPNANTFFVVSWSTHPPRPVVRPVLRVGTTTGSRRK